MTQTKGSPTFVVRITDSLGNVTGYAIAHQVELVSSSAVDPEEHSAAASFDALFASAGTPLAALNYTPRRNGGGCYTAASGFPLS